MVGRSLALWLGFAGMTHSTLASSSHASSSSAPALLDPPLLTLSGTHTRYLCTPLTQCLPCLPAELDTPACSVWGNRRRLSCQVYKSLNPSPIDDPDAQHDAASNRTTTSPATENAPSQFYEYEPGSTRTDAGSNTPDDDELFGGEADAQGRTGTGANDAGASRAQKESDEVLAELRDVLNAERRKRATGPSRDEDDEDRVLYVTLERRAGDDDERRIETYEACPKVVKREQSDYFEFVSSPRLVICRLEARSGPSSTASQAPTRTAEPSRLITQPLPEPVPLRAPDMSAPPHDGWPKIGDTFSHWVDLLLASQLAALRAGYTKISRYWRQDRPTELSTRCYVGPAYNRIGGCGLRLVRAEADDSADLKGGWMVKHLYVENLDVLQHSGHVGGAGTTEGFKPILPVLPDAKLSAKLDDRRSSLSAALDALARARRAVLHVKTTLAAAQAMDDLDEVRRLTVEHANADEVARKKEHKVAKKRARVEKVKERIERDKDERKKASRPHSLSLIPRADSVPDGACSLCYVQGHGKKTSTALQDAKDEKAQKVKKAKKVQHLEGRLE
ncbi:hypothetical protein JCM11491_004525 [Sporobolomyces phaffii]